MLDLGAPEVRTALQAGAWASQLVRQIQSEIIPQALTKEDRSPVTIADFASQALVGFLLSQTFPREELVGEEDSQSLRDPSARDLLEQAARFVTHYIPLASPRSICQWIDRGAGEARGRFWALDPVDGTKGFLRGGQYVVALALIDSGQVQLGVLGCPNLDVSVLPGSGPAGSIFISVRGQGAWQARLEVDRQAAFVPEDFSRLQVSPLDDPEQARLLRSFEAAHTNVEKLDQLARCLHVKPDPQRMDSQVKYALLAAGRGEVLIKPRPASDPGYREKIWDHAAGMLMVEEAGGKVTDLDGTALDFTTGRTLEHNRGVLATNGRLHTAFLEALKTVRI